MPTCFAKAGEKVAQLWLADTNSLKVDASVYGEAAGLMCGGGSPQYTPYVITELDQEEVPIVSALLLDSNAAAIKYGSGQKRTAPAKTASGTKSTPPKNTAALQSSRPAVKRPSGLLIFILVLLALGLYFHWRA